MSRIRDYFNQQGVFEVDVPVLGLHTVSDPHIQSIPAQVQSQKAFLQSSPEYFMKRMLAEGSGDIYYLGKAFRDDEVGKKHNPEFTMLEWYRTESDDKELMKDVEALIRHVLPGSEELEVEHYAYAELFQQELGVNPHIATAEQLAHLARECLDIDWQDDDKSTWLDLLFSHKIEPELQNITFVYDYPACMCALAKVVEVKGQELAKRFEVFWRGHELANGYWELTDAQAQKKRFELDNQRRQKLNRDIIDLDDKFLSALQQGIPECAGVALGVDRLLMCLNKSDDITQVMPFSFSRL